MLGGVGVVVSCWVKEQEKVENMPIRKADRWKPARCAGGKEVEDCERTRIGLSTTSILLSLCVLDSGGIHKVLLSNNQATVLAMYQPFPPRTRILGATLHPSSVSHNTSAHTHLPGLLRPLCVPQKKLYVHTDKELVQLDVARCSHYGDQCEDCVLARDPDCGWNGTHCTPG